MGTELKYSEPGILPHYTLIKMGYIGKQLDYVPIYLTLLK